MTWRTHLRAAPQAGASRSRRKEQWALQAGATSMMEPADQFYGDRNAGVKDPCGNIWRIATHKEDVPPDELARRAEARMNQQRGG